MNVLIEKSTDRFLLEKKRSINMKRTVYQFDEFFLEKEKNIFLENPFNNKSILRTKVNPLRDHSI